MKTPFTQIDIVVIASFACGWAAGRLTNGSVVWRDRINFWAAFLGLVRSFHSLFLC